KWEDQHPACPHCGAQAHRLEGTTRRVIATLFGRVTGQRRRFRCQQCGRSFCPAKSLFVELQGGTVTAPLQDAALLAGCSWPYRAASATLKRLSGAQISAEEIRLLTNRHGQQQAAQQQGEAERVWASADEGPEAVETAEQPMLVGLDGGWVCSREQKGGMEGKVAVVSSHVADLRVPTRSATFSWSERGVKRAAKPRHRLVKRCSVATFVTSELLGSFVVAGDKRVRHWPPPHVIVLGYGAKMYQ